MKKLQLLDFIKSELITVLKLLIYVYKDDIACFDLYNEYCHIL